MTGKPVETVPFETGASNSRVVDPKLPANDRSFPATAEGIFDWLVDQSLKSKIIRQSNMSEIFGIDQVEVNLTLSILRTKYKAQINSTGNDLELFGNPKISVKMLQDKDHLLRVLSEQITFRTAS